ncbi:MAG: DALR domain-containing protein, partial [Tepidanaerobacteraceae bacterium]
FMHVGYLNIDNQKMSKSLGNFFTVRDILKKYDPEVLRFFMLSSHYRSPINFSEDLMQQAKSSLERLYNALYSMEHLENLAEDRELVEKDKEYLDKLEKYEREFVEAMDDDFNTADAIASLFNIVREYNMKVDEKSPREIVKATKETLLNLGSVLGFFRKFEEKTLLDEEIEQKIREREEARKSKNYALADKIRDELKAQGIILEDTPSGVRWKRQ